MANTYVPQWQDFIGMVKGIIKKNIWKLAHSGYDYDDCLQEAYIKFLQCSKREFENKQHFCTYFFMAFQNQMITLENRNHKYATVQLCQHVQKKDEEETEIQFNVSEEVLERIDQASEEARQAFNFITSLPKDLIKAMVTQNCHRTKDILNNDFLCSALGYDPKQVNVYQELYRAIVG